MILKLEVLLFLGMRLKNFLLHVLFSLIALSAFAQKTKLIVNESFIDELSLRLDTFVYSSEKNTHEYQKEKYLFFKSVSNHDIFELTLYPKQDTSILSIKMIESADFSVIDSLRHFSEQYYRSKLRFNDLDNAKYLTLHFIIRFKSGKIINQEYKLFPYKETYISYDSEPIDLFLDEEKGIEMPCFNVYNINMENDFTEISDYDIKMNQAVNTLKINIKPKILGFKTLVLKLKTVRPFINQQNELTFNLPPIKIRFNIKPNRIDYLNPEKYDVYFNANFKASDDLQFDLNRNMGLRKTYRIEDQQETGGNLIAEIFTQSQLVNSNKILCKIRTFALHRINEGYLYIKDGDKTRFLTNFNIIEKPRIDEIAIMHDGEDWTNNLSVFPGEKFEVRVKGTGLQQSGLQFDGLDNVLKDTTRLSDDVAFFVVKVPLNLPKKKVNVFMDKRSTQYSLLIKEYQKPTDFDFIVVNYDGKTNTALNADVFNKPIFYAGEIKDINLLFDPSKIDENGKLFGKQFFNIEVKVFNSKNDLLEVQNINNIVIAPNETSPRGAYYDTKDARFQPISLNDFLVHKTYSFDPFTQILITVRHDDLKHGTNGYTRTIKLIIKRKYNLDVQVSFPAGLLLYKFNQPTDNDIKYTNLSGISLAFIAQLQFYEEDNVNKFKPYSIGAGFIAIDAFNFSQNSSNRDLGIVTLGTLTPLQRGKLSIPLYLGGGYLINQGSWFVLFGPGLRFSF
ncbi:MAG: hypothetical protein ACKVOU_06750 [Cytophagales bacterium]